MPRNFRDSKSKRRTTKDATPGGPEEPGEDPILDVETPDGFHRPNAGPAPAKKVHPNDADGEPSIDLEADQPLGPDADLQDVPLESDPAISDAVAPEAADAPGTETPAGPATEPPAPEIPSSAEGEPDGNGKRGKKAKKEKRRKKEKKAKGPDGQAGPKGPGWSLHPDGLSRRPTVDEAVALSTDGALALVADGQDGARELVTTHRFGLRLGSHKTGNLVKKLKARFSKEAATETAVIEHEVEEAAASRIEPNERYREIETYAIHPPYAYVRILFDEDRKEYIYQTLEPLLTKTEQEILDFIEDTLVDNLTVSPEELEDADELEFITERFNDVIFDYSIILHEDEGEEEAIKKKLLYYLRRNFIGHGPVDILMSDPYIEDISCDGPHVPIFLYHRKYESMRSTVLFGEHEKLDAYVIKMAQRSGKHISIAEPILDATMNDGSRLQSTLGKEVSAGGSTFTIRKFRPDPFTPPDLVLFRTMSAEMLAYLWIAVQNGASIMYSGGTASGKTTSLNAILLFIPPNMKIVSIEDTREVNLPHENWIAGITRTGFGPRDQFGRQAGEIDMFQLLKNALRQRPEYIIVGEVRGQEAYSLFQAMATGHAAYGTMHADSVDAVIHRLESDPINIPRSLLEALDIVSVQIQTRVDGKRVRRTKQISEIVGLDPHTREILTNEVFRWMPKDDSFRFSGVSYILERIQLEKGMASGSMVKELKRRAEIIEWMIRMQIQDYQDVSRVVSAYYKEPEIVLGIVRGEILPDEAPANLQALARGGKSDDSPLSAATLAATPGADNTAAQEPTPTEGAAPPTAAVARPAPEHETEEDPLAEASHPRHPSMPDAPAESAGEPTAPALPMEEGDAEGWGPADVAEPTEKAHEWGGTDAFLGAVEEAERGDRAAGPDRSDEDPAPAAIEAPSPPDAASPSPEDGSGPPHEAASDDEDPTAGDPGPEDEDWLREVEEKIRSRYEELEKAKRSRDDPDPQEESKETREGGSA